MAESQCPEEFVGSAHVVATSYELLLEPKPRPPYDALIEKGLFGEKDMTELAAVVVDGVKPRQSDSDNVVYQLTGGSFHDLFIATWGYEWATSRGLGVPFDLRS